MTTPIGPIEKIYLNLGKGLSDLKMGTQRTYQKFKILLDQQHQLIQKYDAQLYPVALAVASVALFCFSSLTFFTLGALFAVSNGEKWKEALITPLQHIWDSSTLGKMALIAFGILVVAPYKWNIAAFSFGILAIQELKKP